MKRTRDELLRAFDVQKSALAASCRSYDEGNKWEALRLATATYTLVHDYGKKGRSILGQLGVKDKMKFLSTGYHVGPKVVGHVNPMVTLQLHVDRPSEYIPRFSTVEEPIRQVSFGQWWERDIIIKDGTAELTRKRLVFVLRNQEGGSHFDDEVRDPAYVSLTRSSNALVIRRGHEPQLVFAVELATMRQVAWELTKTLADAEI
jgi:hypothetical protein